MQRIEYLKQADILQNQHGTTINEQIKPSSLYEINLIQENNNKAEEENNYYTKNYQPFTTNKYGKAAIQCDKPTYFSTNLTESTTSHNEEPSQWLPKQDDSPLLETENNTEDNDSFSELLKKVNEALETRDEAYDEEKELLNKINEILKTNNRKIGNKVNKMRVDESNSYHRDSKSHDSFVPYDEDEDTGRVCDLYEKRALLDNNRFRMYENVNNDDVPRINYVPITDDSIHESDLKSLIRKYTSSRNIPRDDVNEPTCAYRNSFYNPAYLNNESNTIANLEEQFTGASLEYWGNNSIGSVEHYLTQSEWNILKSPNESMNWLQHSFSQSNWLRSNTSSPNLRQRDLYA